MAGATRRHDSSQVICDEHRYFRTVREEVNPASGGDPASDGIGTLFFCCSGPGSLRPAALPRSACLQIVTTENREKDVPATKWEDRTSLARRARAVARGGAACGGGAAQRVYRPRRKTDACPFANEGPSHFRTPSPCAFNAAPRSRQGRGVRARRDLKSSGSH